MMLWMGELTILITNSEKSHPKGVHFVQFWRLLARAAYTSCSLESTWHPSLFVASPFEGVLEGRCCTTRTVSAQGQLYGVIKKHPPKQPMESQTTLVATKPFYRGFSFDGCQ